MADFSHGVDSLLIIILDLRSYAIYVTGVDATNLDMNRNLL